MGSNIKNLYTKANRIIESVLLALKDLFKLISKLIKVKYKTATLLAVVPLLLLWVAFSLKHWSGPYWLGSNSDPEYVYLLSSLDMTQLKRITYTDHPGTTLQIMGAIVLETVHIFRHGNNLVTDVLTNPELYLNSINYLIIFLIVASVYIIGVFTYSLTNNRLYGIIMESTPFLSILLLRTLYRVSPEPLLLLSGMWYSFFVLYLYFYKHIYKLRHVVMLSVITGLLLATKINTIPLIILPLVIFPFKEKIKYLLFSFVSFIAFTLPICKSYLNFVFWVYALFIHNGIYGAGSSTIINSKIFFVNFVKILVSNQILLILIIGFCLILALYFPKRRTSPKYNYIIGLLMLFLTQTVLVSKHFGLHYMIPTLSICGMAIVVIPHFVSIGQKRLQKTLLRVSIILVMVLVARNLISIMKDTEGVSGEYVDTVNMDKIIKENYSNYTKVSYYRSSSQEFALSFGNSFTYNWNYGDHLAALYQNNVFYEYNLATNSFYSWKGMVKIPDESMLIFQGTTGAIIPELGRNSSFKQVYQGVSESLYIIN